MNCTCFLIYHQPTCSCRHLLVYNLHTQFGQDATPISLLIRGEIQITFLSRNYWCKITIDVTRNSSSQRQANLSRTHLKVVNMFHGHRTCIKNKPGIFFLFPPIPPHVLCGLRGPPSWAWQECNRLLRLGRP